MSKTGIFVLNSRYDILQKIIRKYDDAILEEKIMQINLNEFQTYHKSNLPGLYALFIKNEDCLSKIFTPAFCKKILNHMKQNNCKNCIYIGKETNKLYERIEKKHINGDIRHSTLRYTISYCANMDRYKVKGISISKKRKIKKSDEKRITKWINENCDFKIIETNDYNSLEKQFINKFCLPLNITNNPKPIIARGERTQGFIDLDKDDFDNI